MVTYPDDWKEDKIDNIVIFKNGQAHENDISINGKYVVVNSKFISSNGSVKKHSNKRNQPAECFDVLMVMSDLPNGKALGKCYYVEKNDVYTVNQRICSLSNSKINSKLLYYLVNRNPYFLEFDNGVTQTNLRRQDVVECPIKYPQQKEEQDEIVSTLTDFNEHIDNLTELIEKKKAIRDGALEDLVSGKTRLDGFNGEWETIPFNQYFTLLPTNTYSREQLSDSGAIGNIHYGDVLIKYGSVLSENDYIPRIIDTSKVNAKQYLKKNDVIIADTAEDEIVGKAVQVGDVNMTLVSGLHTMACRPNYPTADGFLGYYINSNRYHDQILPYVTGIKVSSISKKSIGETELNIPLDIAEQQAIASVLTAMDEEIQSLEIEKAKMIEIKEGAMDDLLTGRVRLKI